MRAAASALAFVAIALVSVPAAQPPDVRARIDAYVTALSSGSPQQFEAMAKEHFTPELFARNASQRDAMVQRVHVDFGALEVANETMTGADGDEVHALPHDEVRRLLAAAGRLAPA